MNAPDELPEQRAESSVRVSRPRAIVLHLTLVLFAMALLVKTARVQLVDSDQWVERAQRQHMTNVVLPAPRGVIADDAGIPIAVSREQVQLTISPNLIRPDRADRSDRDTLARELRALGVSRDVIRRALDTTRRYVSVRQLVLPSQVQTLMSLQGVKGEWTMQRILTGSPALEELVGRLNSEGEALSGLELSLDTLLEGTQGTRRAVRDRRGRRWDSPAGSIVDSRPGHTVRLTINRQLQEIVERELMASLQRTGASGGDLVVLDPNDGAILALAGARDGRIASSVTPLTEPYQPGSVLKPMFVAHLLANGRTTANTRINTENGVWVTPLRRLTDEHKEPSMTVFDVVRWSSNIGTVKLVSEHMSRDEVYGLLRDYGFGVFTGVPYPSEARGQLADPRGWTEYSVGSMAIGYEISVTPVQLAIAYAALANGGELLEPALVREIRAPDSSLMFRHARRVVRRVATEQSTAVVRDMLKAVVDSGTGRAAGLAAFEVGGKSGTAIRAGTARSGGREYDATFAGMFPMSDPQLVVVARLIRPTTAIFGGVVAGPMVRAVLSGAMAARNAALDRSVLQRVARDIPMTRESLAVQGAATATPRLQQQTSDVLVSALDSAFDAPAPRDIEPTAGRVIVTLPHAAEPVVSAVSGTRVVPSVRGLSVREAVRTLSAAGFRVKLTRGVAGRTSPAAGSVVRVGAVVLLEDDSI